MFSIYLFVGMITLVAVGTVALLIAEPDFRGFVKTIAIVLAASIALFVAALAVGYVLVNGYLLIQAVLR